MSNLARWIRVQKVIASDQEWLSWDHPTPLWRLLRGKAGERKARLFEAACLRRLSHWPPLAGLLWAVETVEREADGAATPDEVGQARAALRTVRQEATWVMGGMWNRVMDDTEANDPDPWSWAGMAAEAMEVVAGRLARQAEGLEDDRPGDEHLLAEQRAQCDLLRCIFFSPFRQPPSLDSRWLAWNDGTVPRLAVGIYREQAFDRLPILADALEDAGCMDADLLDHLRGTGIHVRGCWAVDLVLRRN